MPPPADTGPGMGRKAASIRAGSIYNKEKAVMPVPQRFFDGTTAIRNRENCHD